VSRAKDILLSGLVLVASRGRRKPRRDAARIVPDQGPNPGAETAAILLLFLSGLCGVAFVVVYVLDRIPHQTQFLGLAIGGAFVFLAAALITTGLKLIVTEELADEYPPNEHPHEQQLIADVVEESASRLTRKKLLLASGGAAVGALGVAAITPAVSFGPVFDMGPFYEANWKRGRRLVDEKGRPYLASEIEEQTFYTAFPENQVKETFGSPVIVVRLDPAELQLPPERQGWAPDGIVAYSKICTHAGCAISLYRTPKFDPTQPKPALVCPCHYSTFDPATGGLVLFGPAGRRLPQLPLEVDGGGHLRAKANFSEPVGPSWWGVRLRGAKSA
jgi:ubiquinol-cytochrome c reductase iron-sulfur subunit